MQQKQQTSTEPPIWGAMSIPISQEAEEATNGGILVNPAVYYEVANILEPSDFYILRNRYVFEAYQTIVGRNEPIDYMTLLSQLKTSGKLEEIGGAAYLMHLMNSVPTSMHTTVYAQLVKRSAIRRQLMVHADHIKALAVDESKELSEVIQGIEKHQIEVLEDYSGAKTQTIGTAMSSYYERIEHRTLHPELTSGIQTGFRDLDKTLRIEDYSLTLFGGRPGMGKTAWMLSAALNMAKAGLRPAIFSMEMSVEQLLTRLTAMEATINTKHLQNGALSESEWSRFVKASGELSKLPIFLDDSTTWTPQQLKTKATSMKFRSGVDIIIVDYVGLMSGGGRYKDNKVAEAGFISRSLKNMAADLKLPVLAAIQLNRNLENRQDKRPVLSDLRESGDWEQDADNVLFIYRDEVYNNATEFPNQADIIIAKQRNGPTGYVSLYFEKSLTKFMNASERSVDLSSL